MKRKSEVNGVPLTKRSLPESPEVFPELFFPRRTPNEMHIARNWRPPLPLSLQSVLLNPIHLPPPPPPPVPTPPPPPNPPEPPTQRREPKFRNWRHPPKGQKLKGANAVEVKQEKILLITFPDPKITQQLVRGFSSAINSVIFQQPVTPRQCLVKLNPEADVDAAIAELRRIPFGGGMISAELKPERKKGSNEIDLRCLIVGNLPFTVTRRAVKDIFPAAQRVDLIPRINSSQTAIVHFKSPKVAFDAYRNNRVVVFEKKDFPVRFYRKRESPRAQMPALKRLGEKRLVRRRKTEPQALLNVSVPQESASRGNGDTKDNILEETAAKLQEDFSPEVSVKIEIDESSPSICSAAPSIPATIKIESNETNEKDLGDKLYEKLISAQGQVEEQEEHTEADEDFEDDGKSDGSQEEANNDEILSCTPNDWEQKWREMKPQLTEIPAPLSTTIDEKEIVKFSSMLSSKDFGDSDEQNDSDLDDLFNKLNPTDDSDDEELNVFSS